MVSKPVESIVELPKENVEMVVEYVPPAIESLPILKPAPVEPAKPIIVTQPQPTDFSVISAIKLAAITSLN